ncbi:MAG: spore coat protein [Oscillospiraceae bacterium]|jgi:protein-arginine kinase activator protein McsA|nr:spore coat protein [Oscillospiraceae bacterium]
MAELKVCECCGKETAAVFITKKTGDSERRQALCLQCAGKQKIPTVREYVKRQKKPDAAVRICEQCREQPATVFVSVSKDGEAPEQQAFCAFCARERNLPQVAETMASMEMSDEELRQIHADILNQAQMQKPKGILQKLRQIFKS